MTKRAPPDTANPNRARAFALAALTAIACSEVVHAPGDASVCVPQCTARACGSNGCGGRCGECDATERCIEGACRTAPAACDDRDCGPDGAGGTCGECDPDERCVEGACELGPDPCLDRDCGPDGLGGTCGSCTAPGTCVDGTCAPCVPDCGDRACGDDGCLGSCGGCDPGSVCTAAGACECATPTSCFPDRDGDGYPIETGVMTVCGTCLEGTIPARSDGAVDCFDLHAEVHPGAGFRPSTYCTMLGPVPGLCAASSSDWNCDGVSEMRWSARGSCLVGAGGCMTRAGWLGPPPACQSSSTFITTCASPCAPVTESRTQECR